MFFDSEKNILKDTFHFEDEERFILIGKTKDNRYLFLVFTIWKNKIRVISARDLNKKERRDYYEKKLKVPEFKSDEKEKEFWKNIDLTEYYSKDDFKEVSFPDLKPTSRSISIRLPEFLLTRLKEKANELNIPYQS